MKTQLSTETTSPAPSITQQLSRPLLVLSALLLGAGIVTGLMTYLNRSPIRQKESAGTAEWIPHFCLFGVALVWFVVARIRNQRRHPGQLLMLAVVGKSAENRLRHTVRAAAHNPSTLGRLVIGILPAAVLLYGYYRSGMQILGGLDPNFTTNAWGGPSYLGAMACHYLDGALMMAVSGLLLHRFVLNKRM